MEMGLYKFASIQTTYTNKPLPKLVSLSLFYLEYLGLNALGLHLSKQSRGICLHPSCKLYNR